MHYIQLRAFHAVATYGGFSKAANQLCLTQPAISDQVKKLEEHFGILLFHRHNRAVRPTEIGEQLLDVTRRMFGVETEAIELLKQSQKLVSGFLNIASDAPFHAIEMISQFRTEYPGIRIALKRGNSDTILKQLHDFSADIGIIATKPEEPSLMVIPLRSDAIVCYFSKENPLAQKKSISIRELAKQPLIYREKGSNTRQRVEQAFEKHKLIPNITMVAEGRDSNQEAIAAGMGVGLISGPELGHDSRLTSIPITGADISMDEYVVYLKERKHMRLLKAFIETVGLPIPEGD